MQLSREDTRRKERLEENNGSEDKGTEIYLRAI